MELWQIGNLILWLLNSQQGIVITILIFLAIWGIVALIRHLKEKHRQSPKNSKNRGFSRRTG